MTDTRIYDIIICRGEKIMNKDFLESTKYKINSIINDLAYENNGEYTMLIADLEIAEERVEELEEEDGKK